MANFLDFSTPGGTKGNLAKPSTVLPIVLGGFVLLAGLSMSERLLKTASGRVPFISAPTNPFQSPAMSSGPTQAYFG